MPKVILPGAAALIIAILALLFIPVGQVPAMTFKQDMVAAAGATIGGLAAIAAILERALAVFTDLLFGQERTEARQQLNTARLTVPLPPPPPAPGAAPLAPAAQAAVVQAQTEARAKLVAPALAAVEAVDAKRERARLLLGFAAAFMISAAGARTLIELIDTTKATLTPFGTMVDIMLTAGLLAGGSNALAKLVEVLQEGANKKLTNLRTDN